MVDWRQILIPPETPILRALEIIDRGALRLGLVADANGRLLGVVTDGDVRRGLLRRISLADPVTAIMSPNPVTARINESREQILARMRARDLYHIPILDQDGLIVRLETLQELAQPGPRDNWVVIMAGGLGSRLGSLTRNRPKPLLKIGQRPILEIILEGFLEYGFRRFFFSVNYKKEMIESHFGDGSQWGVDIQYLREESRLGTAGSLSLLPAMPELPFFVMNGDLLTKINFTRILDYHQEQAAQATLCVRQIEETIPYGVVEMDQNRLVTIREKPVQRHFINAGIYLLDPILLPLIPANACLDMPDMLRLAMEAGHGVAVFPFLEYWLDIGRLPDFHQACRDYPETFE